ncbi:MAG: hypothetical protein L6243_04810 [Candidatus Altiarchaeales archaeon]|nr:hypothetical protein [Candidatus Altiarchaeota archaeon]MCG2782890.1 hypothetical protein [Candidatus Altiarchaeales archaeon]MBU4267189.1 hypothetical protein [Candidatus Altiarchaeota archaeon]MBU4341778.1 hypothetical protein [Candidatus Altiarchaeota archaeon]MBU4406908.1 hypothetical protein [Candidatus Altiarchaeota archaeon]
MSLEKSDVWINQTKSGNGFTVRVGDMFYTGSIQTLARFVSGEIKGVNLSLVVPDEAEE